MTVHRETYDAFHARYISALDWMASLGLSLSSRRTQHYESVIDYWRKFYSTAPEHEVSTEFPSFVTSVFEMHDFIAVWETLHKKSKEELASIITKLQAATAGPIASSTETAQSNHARNTLFEAVVSARFHAPDRRLEAILDPPTDAAFNYEGRNILVECKRPMSLSKLEANVRDASSQLDKQFQKHSQDFTSGLVAIDFSKFLSPGDELFRATTELMLMRRLHKKMDWFILQNNRIWNRVYERRTDCILGTLLRFSFMCVSDADQLLIYTSQWGINPRDGLPSGRLAMLRQLAECMDQVLNQPNHAFNADAGKAGAG